MLNCDYSYYYYYYYLKVGKGDKMTSNLKMRLTTSVADSLVVYRPSISIQMGTNVLLLLLLIIITFQCFKRHSLGITILPFPNYKIQIISKFHA